jgi:hypothetical protein
LFAPTGTLLPSFSTELLPKGETGMLQKFRFLQRDHVRPKYPRPAKSQIQTGTLLAQACGAGMRLQDARRDRMMAP